MTDVMQTIKNCINELYIEFDGGGDNLIQKIEKLQDNKPELFSFFDKIYTIQLKHYELVKEQITIEFFVQLCQLHMQYNFIGGAVVAGNEDAIIEIK